MFKWKNDTFKRIPNVSLNFYKPRKQVGKERRPSLQPLSTSQQNSIVTHTLLNPSAVPRKTLMKPLSRANSVPVDVISQIESDATLSAREKLVKVRQEMRRRYELLRQASEMRRDETFQPYRAAKIRNEF